MTLRIAMWSGPRNISTAMMRSWGNRTDAVVSDEPFYAHYLSVTGADHPGRNETLASQEADASVVASMLRGPAPGGAAIWYQKHMAHHLLPDTDRSWMESAHHCFLIRHPAAMLASLHAKTPFPSLEDTGLPQQLRLFEEDMARGNGIPPVLDADDVLENPGGVLRLLCTRLGMEFQENMLSWPPGLRETDGAWAPFWYRSVESSTGFRPPGKSEGEVPSELDDVLESCTACYEVLHRHRIKE